MPAGGGLRGQVLRECHNSPLGGHFGCEKTVALVRWVGAPFADLLPSCAEWFKNNEFLFDQLPGDSDSQNDGSKC